jgi:hypothetical protein
MTIWPARLSKDGTKILCGWHVGRANCTAMLAGVEDLGWGLRPYFQAFYEQDRPQEPGEPLYLRIGTHAADKLAHGEVPVRRRAATTEDGTRVNVIKPWSLPVVVPCKRGHVSKVDSGTLDG